MQIKMFVKEGGFVAFECQGVLKELPEKIVLNRDTRLVSIIFSDQEDVELDCQIDEEVVDAVGPHPYCIMGFCEDKRVLGATMIKFEGVGGKVN